MTMYNPPHPGEFIRETYIEPFDISIRSLAENLGVAASTLARVVSEHSAVSPEMALRLSVALGRSPESWLAMQDNYDLWQARKSITLSQVRKIPFETLA
jgi:addiction module HigA family antidote